MVADSGGTCAVNVVPFRHFQAPLNAAAAGLAAGAPRADNAGMRLYLLACMTAALLSGQSVFAQEITIYRCVGTKGELTLQDAPCAKDQQQSERVMTRPKDAPPRPAPEPRELPDESAEPLPDPPAALPLAPPPMYICTSYDGKQRESEVYDPNPRCEPYILYHPNAAQLPPEWQTACRWVEDSCVRLSDEQACQRFVRKHREAKSAALHAFSSDAAYRKSELARLAQIVEESCRR